MTLEEIIEKYPEFKNLEVVIYTPTGEYHYINDNIHGLGSVYKAKDYEEGIDVVVFAAN